MRILAGVSIAVCMNENGGVVMLLDRFGCESNDTVEMRGERAREVVVESSLDDMVSDLGTICLLQVSSRAAKSAAILYCQEMLFSVGV